MWDLARRKIAQVFQGHRSEIYSLSHSPDGRLLVSGSGDKTARVWDMLSGRCVLEIPVDDHPSQESGGSKPASGAGATPDAGVTAVAFSPDGNLIAGGSLDWTVRVWDARTGAVVDTLHGHRDSVYSVAFSPDGAFLVSASLDKTLKVWNAQGWRAEPRTVNAACLSTLQGHKDYVLSVDVTPDGAWIVSGSKDRGVQFWDPKSAKAQFMLQGHKNSVISVAVSPTGGQIATGSGDWTARIWSYEKFSA